MNNGKTRASLMAIVAAYLLYTCYELFQGRSNPDTTMAPAVTILFIVLFFFAACALLVYAYRLWKHSGKEEDTPPPPDDKNSMK